MGEAGGEAQQCKGAPHQDKWLSVTPRAFSLDLRGIPGVLGATSPWIRGPAICKVPTAVLTRDQVMSPSSFLCLWRSPCQTSRLGWGLR